MSRLKLLKDAIDAVPRVPYGEGHAHDGVAPVKPTPAQIDVAFRVAKAAVNVLVAQLVPPWAMNMVHITDQEIHLISDRVTKAVVNTEG